MPIVEKQLTVSDIVSNDPHKVAWCVWEIAKTITSMGHELTDGKLIVDTDCGWVNMVKISWKVK